MGGTCPLGVGTKASNFSNPIRKAGGQMTKAPEIPNRAGDKNRRSPSAEERKKRLAQALRRNILKRKDQKPPLSDSTVDDKETE